MITKGLIFKIKLSRYWRIEIYNYWEWNGYENMGDLEMWVEGTPCAVNDCLKAVIIEGGPEIK